MKVDDATSNAIIRTKYNPSDMLWSVSVNSMETGHDYESNRIDLITTSPGLSCYNANLNATLGYFALGKLEQNNRDKTYYFIGKNGNGIKFAYNSSEKKLYVDVEDNYSGKGGKAIASG